MLSHATPNLKWKSKKQGDIADYLSSNRVYVHAYVEKYMRIYTWKEEEEEEEEGYPVHPARQHVAFFRHPTRKQPLVARRCVVVDGAESLFISGAWPRALSFDFRQSFFRFLRQCLVLLPLPLTAVPLLLTLALHLHQTFTRSLSLQCLIY